MSSLFQIFSLFFFFNDTATTEIYTLSLHDALPIWSLYYRPIMELPRWFHQLQSTHLTSIQQPIQYSTQHSRWQDRKSTRLNSSHDQISYAVFCLKKKKQAYTAFLSRLS